MCFSCTATYTDRMNGTRIAILCSEKLLLLLVGGSFANEKLQQLPLPPPPPQLQRLMFQDSQHNECWEDDLHRQDAKNLKDDDRYSDSHKY